VNADTTFVLFIAGGAISVAALLCTCLMAIHLRRVESEFKQRQDGLPTISEVSDAQARLAGLREELANLRKQLAEGQLLIETAEVARKDLERLRVEILSLDTKRQELRAVSERFADVSAQLEKTQAELLTSRKELAAITVDHETKRIQIERLDSAIVEATNTLSKLQAEIRTAVSAKADLEQSLVALRREYEELLSRKSEADRAVSDLRQQIFAAEGELSRLQHQIENAKRDVQVLSGREDMIRKSIDQLVAERNNVQSDLDKIHKDLAKLARPSSPQLRFEAIVSDPPFKQGECYETLTQKDGLERVANHARALGFIYPRRVLNAFHTSLKIDSKAPLMVLAGISGTGKSQLPRLYADALGFNFLPVSVQPGWDSPQDLVGFFSHLEGRFRPTKLLQALVQMDQYLPQSGLPQELLEKWKVDQCRDQMLLVLLDEMNLARVEYYFSEFLSRLELRNSAGANVADQKMRERSSIGIEGGPGDAKKLDVFVDHNVLFVGTMNEDESTQSLSDKVVDRANVMRFGTPKKLQTAAGRPAIDNARTPKKVTRKIWDGWKQERAEPIIVGTRSLADYIEELNKGLKHIHRSFGHRTAGAIEAYVRQYPRDVPVGDPLKFALADQIEQRVMPKLRGVDPSTADGSKALEIISAVVAQLDDPDLSQAIKRGREANEGSQFVWFGVDRGED
jgi:predicted  nucleic acid-binding Zn-ribbon protein